MNAKEYVKLGDKKLESDRNKDLGDYEYKKAIELNKLIGKSRVEEANADVSLKNGDVVSAVQQYHNALFLSKENKSAKNKVEKIESFFTTFMYNMYQNLTRSKLVRSGHIGLNNIWKGRGYANASKGFHLGSDVEKFAINVGIDLAAINNKYLLDPNVSLEDASKMGKRTAEKLFDHMKTNKFNENSELSLENRALKYCSEIGLPKPAMFGGTKKLFYEKYAEGKSQIIDKDDQVNLIPQRKPRHDVTPLRARATLEI